MTDHRLEKLTNLMDQFHINILALNPGPTLTYLTGLQFHLMERPTVLLIPRSSQPLLILPELESGKVVSSRIPLLSFTYNDDPSTWQAVFDKAAKQFNREGTILGVEPNRMRFLELEFLQKAIPSAKIVSADQICGLLRVTKDPDEIKEMRKAVQIAQDALKATLPAVIMGAREKDIAAELTIQILKAGSDSDIPFAPIVASGPNSANPHAVPTDRKLENGDLVVIDWGARSNGYCSDLTRTFGIGSLSPELMKVYKTVQQANAAGRAAGKPGKAAGKVDKAAREVIENAGLGPWFTHRTGHGLGMEDHEIPYIFSGNTLMLATGMAYTVEPGIYLQDKGGVRIEDDMVVTVNGSESLSDFSRDLTIL